MTKPVAYIRKTSGGTYISQMPIGDNYGAKTDKTLPLYTKDQLHQRVKMTQAEFDEFTGLYGKEYGGRGNVFFGLDQAINLGDYYPYLNKRLITDKQFDDNSAQAEFVNLWIKFDPSHPEKTIEIVPDMKWFVRSKEKYEADIVQGLPESGYLYLTDGGSYSVEYCEMTTFKDDATQFDTKEEAEKWTNPLIEAVQLPVDDDND
ncbi:hypothetical protein RQW99_01940 [Leuconostoc falkenbergense]|uniref:hypothetical protein n=1 Tax=Leuconostoc falkenbergense TaxID=2766470 RepID=UPI002A80004F|nr:hypothetical protein [Leuconostoc falkenbergense]MDY5163311.1 hypothetical protein [Leuconostoc falkenbergense]